MPKTPELPTVGASLALSLAEMMQIPDPKHNLLEEGAFSVQDLVWQKITREKGSVRLYGLPNLRGVDLSQSFAAIETSPFPGILRLMVTYANTNQVARFTLITRPLNLLTSFQLDHVKGRERTLASTTLLAKRGDSYQFKLGELTVHMTIESVELDEAGNFKRVRIKILAAALKK